MSRTPLTSIESIMARIAAGDTSAIFEFAATCGDRIAGAVRHHLRRCGVDRFEDDDVQGLVLEVCVSIAEVAGAWRPGEATPWRWADGRVRAIVSRFVGIHADSLDADDGARARLDALVAETPLPVFEVDVAAVYERLARSQAIIGRFDLARRQAMVSDDDLYFVLRYRIQQDQGDPSPSQTLAAESGISAAAVRKRISRSRARMRVLIEADAGLADFAGFVLAA